MLRILFKIFYLNKKSFIPVLISIFFSSHIFSQTNVPAAQSDSNRIQIKNADYLEIIQYKGQSTYHLVNNVELIQKNIVLYCDSALVFKAGNIAKAYGNVHFVQADSIDAYGDSATYDGNKGIAILYKNVTLTDNATVLTTNELTYNLNTRVAEYHNGGTIKDTTTTLTSDNGYYYANTDDAYFKTNVKLTHPKYNLEADTLRYNTAIDRAYFLGPTTIYNQNSKVYSEKGYYDSKEGIAVFSQNAVLDDPPKRISADSIYYNRETGIGKAFGNIVFSDTSQNILQYSNIATYNELTNTILSTSGSIAAYIVDKDTLYISGDTIRAVQDTVSKKNTMKIFHNVKIYKADLQGLADSLFYTDLDSTLRMYGAPVLWSDSSQFTADTIYLMIKNKHIDKIEMRTNGFIVNESDSLIYNQVKGRIITGYFKNDSLNKVQVRGNAESIYYVKDNKNKYVGVNKSVSSDIDIKMHDKKFSRITYKNQIEQHVTPMQQVDVETLQLEGFDWQYNYRPKSKNDLLLTAPRHVKEEKEKPSMERSSQKDG